MIASTTTERAGLPRCEATCPDGFARAGEQCEREAHAEGTNHKIAPGALPVGAVWSDAPARRDGGR
jgi:hypothetical protein